MGLSTSHFTVTMVKLFTCAFVSKQQHLVLVSGDSVAVQLGR